MLNVIKTQIRKIRYKFKLSQFPKPDIINDKIYPHAHNLRKKGISTEYNFHKKNEKAKKIIDLYENLNKEEIFDYIKQNSNSKNKSSYKSRISKYFPEQDLINFANDKFIIDNIKQYFGFKPYLRIIEVVVDYKNNFFDQAVHTQLFHRDADDVKLTKIFFYLENVNINNGPFQFVERSHRYRWQHVNLDEQSIQKKYGENSLHSCTGDKGTLIFADTNGIHRGLVLKEKFRVMVTAMYTSDKPNFVKFDKVVGQ
jgi:hypothetical protein